MSIESTKKCIGKMHENLILSENGFSDPIVIA